MTDRIHTCPAPTLSRVGFRCGPVRPGRAQFHNFCTSAVALWTPTPYFCSPDPIRSKTCSHVGSNLHAQTVKSDGFAAEGC